MKPTENFKTTIKTYLDQRAKDDLLFQIQYFKPHKNIDDCIIYIFNTVQKSGCHGFTDDEVYSMAVHFYDEDNIEIGGSANCKVVVNHIVELTEEDKQQARQEAMEKAKNEAYKQIKQPKKKSNKTIVDNSPTLFNF